MKHLSALASIPLLVLSACGPGQPGGSAVSDSGSASATASTTNPPMNQSCGAFGEQFEHGEEYEDPNGCYRYRCNNGGGDVLEDNSITTAGDLMIDSQAVMDENICLVAVGGALRLSGAVTDTSPLGNLRTIGADFAVENTDLQQLQVAAISEIGGNVIISNNAQLLGMSFQPYMNIFGDVAIENNDALPSLAGAGFLGACGSCAAANDEAPPEPPGGDEGGIADPAPGGQFYGAILIADNDALTDISVMASLAIAWDDLVLRNNATLSAFPQMALYEVQGNLEVSTHPQLDTTVVDAFVQGVNVIGQTLVCGNLGGEPCL